MINLIAKKHEIDYRIIIAVCDKEHLGKTFEDGAICFTASKKFYEGENITEEELETLLKDADSANLFGEKCVSFALKKGYISEKSILKIKGIPHVQIYRT